VKGTTIKVPTDKENVKVTSSNYTILYRQAEGMKRIGRKCTDKQ
jgi:hypothetical protein